MAGAHRNIVSKQEKSLGDRLADFSSGSTDHEVPRNLWFVIFCCSFGSIFYGVMIASYLFTV